jgi:hypothetical protein
MPSSIGIAVGLLLLLADASPLRAQLTLGATSGAVRYEQQSTTSSIAISPEARLERRGMILDASAGFTSGSDGGRVIDLGSSGWLASRPSAGHLQVDGLLQGSLTHPKGDSASSSALVLGEVAWAPEGHGVAFGLGGLTGHIQGQPSASAVRAEVRGWYDFGDVSATLSIEPTRLSGSWYTEVAAGLETSPGPFDITGSLRVRQVSGSGLAAGGQAAVSWDATPRVAVELDVGRYLRDPFQGLPAGSFVSLAVRWKLMSWKGGGAGGVGQASLGDTDPTANAAAQSLGFGRGSAKSNRSVTTVSHGNSANTGRGHKL